MKSVLFIGLLISLSAHSSDLCNDKTRSDNGHIHYIYPDSVPEKLIKRKVDITPVNDPQMQVELNLVNFESFSGGDKVADEIEIARLRLEKILSSQIFQNEVLNHEYKNKKQFKKNLGKSNSDIYQMIQEGADKYDRTIDNKIDMILCPYYSSKNVYGYTYSNRQEVWINFKYYRDKHNGFTFSDMIGNILHEWIHNLGFSHSRWYNRTRKYTVPYGVGYITRDIARSLD